MACLFRPLQDGEISRQPHVQQAKCDITACLSSDRPWHSGKTHCITTMTSYAGLTQKEQGNATFLFLKPTHSLHGYFQELVAAYRNTLLGDKRVIDKLRRDASDRQAVLERCLNRLEWEKNKEAQDRAASDKLTAERIAMQSIDWCIPCACAVLSCAVLPGFISTTKYYKICN